MMLAHIYTHDACTHDACTHDAYTHDACMHESMMHECIMHISCMHDAYAEHAEHTHKMLKIGVYLLNGPIKHELHYFVMKSSLS